MKKLVLAFVLLSLLVAVGVWYIKPETTVPIIEKESKPLAEVPKIVSTPPPKFEVQFHFHYHRPAEIPKPIEVAAPKPIEIPKVEPKIDITELEIKLKNTLKDMWVETSGIVQGHALNLWSEGKGVADSIGKGFMELAKRTVKEERPFSYYTPIYPVKEIAQPLPKPVVKESVEFHKEFAQPLPKPDRPPIITVSRSFDYEPIVKSESIPKVEPIAQAKEPIVIFIPKKVEPTTAQQTDEKTGLVVNNLSDTDKTVEVNGTAYAIQAKTKKIFVTTPGKVTYKVLGFDESVKSVTLTLGQMHDVTITAQAKLPSGIIPNVSQPLIPMPRVQQPQPQQPRPVYYYYPPYPYYYVGPCGR